jgi:hypothetical protein
MNIARSSGCISGSISGNDMLATRLAAVVYLPRLRAHAVDHANTRLAH